MDSLARELNDILINGNKAVFEMLSELGKRLYFPRGLVTQGMEAKEKAHQHNATWGMATEHGQTMHLPSVMDLVNRFAPEDALTYAPSYGIAPLRKRWQDEIYNKNPSLDNRAVSLPVVTNAITHGVSVVADLWVDPGDTVIIPDKMWGNYYLIYHVRRGASIVQYPFFDHRGGFNLASFHACVQAQSEKNSKLVVVLNFPNNPTGYTLSLAEADGVADILLRVAERGTNVVAIMDDAYFGLFHEDQILTESMFSRLAGREPRLLAVKLDGATKEDFVWGLRVGFITYGGLFHQDPRRSYDALEKKTGGAVRSSISSASHLSQEIVLRTMQSDHYAEEKKQKYAVMKERASEVKRVLADPMYESVWAAYPFNSGYFMCLRLKTVDAETLRVHLLDRYGIGLIALNRENIRIAYSCLDMDDIQVYFDTVYQGIQDLES
jgi:aspartate/methionine/tyrosine aminotransferase